MRYLVIVPSYHPLESPRAWRWTVKVEQLINEGHVVTVLTADDGLISNEMRPETVIRTGYSTPDKRWTQKKTSDRKSPNWAKKMARWFMWPDESTLWIKPALKKVHDLFLDHKFDIVASVSHPFSSHWIAYKLRQKFNFHWIIDIGDPFLHHDLLPRNNQFLYASRNARAEKKVMKEADEIWVTNRSLKDLYQKLYNLRPENIQVVGPVASPIDEGKTAFQPKHDTCDIGYFGTFYDGIRPIHGLKDLHKSIIVQKNKPHFHFFGSIKPHHQTDIIHFLDKKNVTFHPAVPRTRVIPTMKSMDYLLSVGNQSSIQLPSKVVDYELSGQPIIHIQYMEEDLCLDYWPESCVKEVLVAEPEGDR